MPEQYETTRWHDLQKPLSPLDPIGHASMFKKGKLPPGFVLLTWDGMMLSGPMKFPDQTSADMHLIEYPNITHYLPVPMP